ncbi:MAG: PCRF domain-containing protein [Phycisphaeraceae bacterium]|nr:PCRF domain-containing protein [Phycisphaeraceae bacterium]
MASSGPSSVVPFVSLSGLPLQVLEKLEAIRREHDDLDRALQDPDVLVDHKKVRSLSMKKSALAPVASAVSEFERCAREIEELESAAAGSDRELASLAKEELPALKDRARSVVREAVRNLVNAEDAKVGSVILEVRGGTGGDEAALWCRDLFEMYTKYAGKRGWKFEVLDFVPETDAGGIRSAVANVRGDGVWSELAFEAGVHSVKRVPATEAAGRIHTSTATVAVLPEPEDVDVKIDWANDVEEFATRAQGPGGQNVNKVETAWQIHHKPSGIIIKMMEAKSQQQNRERARRLLMTKLYEAERQKQHAERSQARKSQIRGGDRSEKIRTYRWKEGIVADERLPGEYQLRDVISGDLNKLMTDLVEQETAKRVAEL